MKLSPNLHEICHDHNCLEGSVLAKTGLSNKKKYFFFLQTKQKASLKKEI